MNYLYLVLQMFISEQKQWNLSTYLCLIAIWENEAIVMRSNTNS